MNRLLLTTWLAVGMAAARPLYAQPSPSCSLVPVPAVLDPWSEPNRRRASIEPSCTIDVARARRVARAIEKSDSGTTRFETATVLAAAATLRSSDPDAAITLFLHLQTHDSQASSVLWPHVLAELTSDNSRLSARTLAQGYIIGLECQRQENEARGVCELRLSALELETLCRASERFVNARAEETSDLTCRIADAWSVCATVPRRRRERVMEESVERFLLRPSKSMPPLCSCAQKLSEADWDSGRRARAATRLLDAFEAIFAAASPSDWSSHVFQMASQVATRLGDLRMTDRQNDFSERFLEQAESGSWITPAEGFRSRLDLAESYAAAGNIQKARHILKSHVYRAMEHPVEVLDPWSDGQCIDLVEQIDVASCLGRILGEGMNQLSDRYRSRVSCFAPDFLVQLSVAWAHLSRLCRVDQDQDCARVASGQAVVHAVASGVRELTLDALTEGAIECAVGRPSPDTSELVNVGKMLVAASLNSPDLEHARALEGGARRVAEYLTAACTSRDGDQCEAGDLLASLGWSDMRERHMLEVAALTGAQDAMLELREARLQHAAHLRTSVAPGPGWSERAAELRFVADAAYRRVLSAHGERPGPSLAEMSTDELSAALDTNAAFLSLIKTPANESGARNYVAFIATREGTRFVQLGNESDLNDAAHAYRDTLDGRRSGNFRYEGDRLYQRLIAPLEEALGGRRMLFVVPSGPLDTVPLVALIKNGEFLLDLGYRVRYLSSALELRARSGAGVAFTDISAPLVLAPFVGEVAHALSASRAEAEAIGALLGVRPRLGATHADAETVRTMRRPQILHIATHGEFEEAHPQAGSQSFVPAASRSSLLFPKFREGMHFQERVSAYEISQLDLHGTQLVVLSACNSAQGAPETGQSAHGLRRAFLIAGAETVVAAMWRVDDGSTETFMRDYYTRLLRQNQPRLDALHDTMRAMKRCNPNARYWAPFVLLGETGPLDLPPTSRSTP